MNIIFLLQYISFEMYNNLYLLSARRKCIYCYPMFHLLFFFCKENRLTASLGPTDVLNTSHVYTRILSMYTVIVRY